VGANWLPISDALAAELLAAYPWIQVVGDVASVIPENERGAGYDAAVLVAKIAEVDAAYRTELAVTYHEIDWLRLAMDTGQSHQDFKDYVDDLYTRWLAARAAV
jgi:hypothetical protein